MENRCVEDFKNVSIPVWVSIFSIFTGKQHNVRLCLRVDSILCPSIVISSIVDPDNAMAVHVIIGNNHICLLFISELIFITIILEIEQMGKQMIEEPRDKILFPFQ